MLLNGTLRLIYLLRANNLFFFILMPDDFLSLSESRSKFHDTTSIQSTGTAKCNNFSTFSTYSDFTYLVNIEILRTYSSITSSQSHTHVHTRKHIFYQNINLCYVRAGEFY
jgi:hypothetical protein